MKDAVVTLTEPVIGHEGPITQLVLRAPKAADFFAFGAPYQQDGAGIMDLPAVVGLYVEKLLNKPELLPQVGLADGLRLRDAVYGFFSDAGQRAFSTSATSLSSTSASSPPPSAAS